MKKVFLIFVTILLILPLTVFAESKDISSYIKSLNTEDNEDFNKIKNGLAYDNTDDKNLRYVGSNPNNYIKFNDELWRIIGVVKTDDGTFTKIVKDSPIGSYKWSDDNNWTASNIQKVLNEDYYKTLSEDAKSMITKITWNTGNNNGVSIKEANSREFYTYNLTNSTWEGYIGLIYPSDYIYASATDRKECLTKNILDKYVSDSNCVTSNYLTSNDKLWTMTTYINSENNNKEAFNISNGIDHSDTTNSYVIKPVAFLSNNIMITEGSGEKTNPYLIKKFEFNKVELELNDEKVFTSLVKSSFGELSEEDIDLNLLINDNDNIKIEDDMIKAVKAGNSEISLAVNGNIYILEVDVNPLSISVPDTGRDSVRLFMMIVVLLIFIIFELIIYIKQVFRHKRHN